MQSTIVGDGVGCGSGHTTVKTGAFLKRGMGLVIRHVDIV